MMENSSIAVKWQVVYLSGTYYKAVKLVWMFGFIEDEFRTV